MTETHRIQSKVITGRQDGPHLLITASVHGDEYEPMAAVRRLMNEIDPDRLSGRVTLVPVLNEPAFENKTRTGPDGLDLARIFPGRPDGSISERVAHAGAPLIASADYFIDLHTGGLAMRIMPMSGYLLHPDPQILQTQRRMARAFNLPIIWGTDPNLDGRSTSVGRDAGVPTLYAEWGGGGGCNPEGVQDYVQGCFNVMDELGMSPCDRPASRVRHVVEDPREGSGHMQVNYNARCAGYFEPARPLGDSVKVGDTLGTVVDPMGSVQETVARSIA